MAGGSSRGRARADERLRTQDQRNEPYHPPQALEERWSPQDFGLGLHGPGSHTDGRRRGNLHSGDFNR